MTELTGKTFDQETAQGLVVVDFWAPWCGPCRMMAPVLEEASKKITDLKVCKVNVDDEGELAMRFRVSAIPTLLFMKNGKIIRTEMGYHDYDSFKAIVDAVRGA